MSDAKVDSNYGMSVNVGKIQLTSGQATIVNSIATSGETIAVSGLIVSAGKILDTQMSITYASGVTVGAALNLYASTDGANFDTNPEPKTVWVNAISINTTTSGTLVKSSPVIDVSGKQKVHIYVRNNDANVVIASGAIVRYAIYN